MQDNKFLHTGTNGRHFWRSLHKNIADLLSVFPVGQWILGRRGALAIYMANAEFGGPKPGIRSASRHFFGVEPEKLTKRQAAQLAANLIAPRVRKKYAAMIERRKNRILKRWADVCLDCVYETAKK